MGRILVRIYDRVRGQPRSNWGGGGFRGPREPPAGEFRIDLGSIRHEEHILRLWYASGPP